MDIEFILQKYKINSNYALQIILFFVFSFFFVPLHPQTKDNKTNNFSYNGKERFDSTISAGRV